MRTLWILVFLISAAGFAAAVVLPQFADLLPIAASAAAISGLLGLRSAHRAKTQPKEPEAGEMLVVDGSNVMFWQDKTPNLDTVRILLEELRTKGFRVGVIFDASAGHVLFSRYVDDAEFAQLLGLPGDQCFVVPKGTIADEYILRAARDLSAGVVTNDRYRDWANDFPEVKEPAHLIGGRFTKGKLYLYSQIEFKEIAS